MPSSPPRRTICVLQVVPALDTGGTERATLDISAALVARGDRALVASEGGRLEEELRQAGGGLTRLPVASKNPAALVLNAFRLARLIRNENVDIVHARSRAPAWSALAASRMTGVPFVTTFHGSYGETNAVKRLYNSVMARGDAVIANSRYTAALIAERYGTRADKIAVIPRGTDLHRFDPGAVDETRRTALRQRWGLSGQDRVVLNLARLTAWKGHRVLIEAAEGIVRDHPEVIFVLAGDAQGREDYRLELLRLIEGRGLARHIRIVGHCDDAPAALTLSAAAVIASTEPEAFGRTAIEAAAMGVPVVATALGATGETVLAPPAIAETERTGWLVPPGDSAALANAIRQALALRPEERARIAIRARRHAQNFTTEAMQEATLAFYDRLAVARR